MMSTIPDDVSTPSMTMSPILDGVIDSVDDDDDNLDDVVDAVDNDVDDLDNVIEAVDEDAENLDRLERSAVNSVGVSLT